MKVTVILADSAQADQLGKVHALGLGWTVVGSPLPAHSVVVIFEVDWHESNEQYHFVLELLNEDGEQVLVSDESGGQNPIRVEGGFEQGRPPGHVKGAPLSQPFVLNLPEGMPLPANHRYEYRVSVAGSDAGAAFSVRQ